MSNLRHAVVEMLQRRSLSEERMRALQGLQRAEPRKSDEAPARRRFVLAAVALAAVAVPALVWHLSVPRTADNDPARRIAEEVAANHLHLKPLEIETSDIAGIRRYFTQLDFLPVESDLAMLNGLDMLGGRYCSVQGVTAAQLRLRASPEGPAQTLYQAPYERDRFGPLPQLDRGESPLSLKVRGLDVVIWVEKDILFALVRQS